MVNLIEGIKIYFIALGIFLVIDGFWLVVVAKNFYAKYLGYLMRPSPLLVAALIFYLIAIVGIVILAVIPGLEQKSMMKAILLGGLFGLCTYATYDLTNLATVKDWPMIVVVVDMMWGTVLSATVAGLTYLAASKII